mmetsp:Transcript_7668/g.11524  ORF Transcript_7668/g.11524 Transcript_7668/m.11524 type:complete len:314 (+) Transcript_7668:134-1075(+)
MFKDKKSSASYKNTPERRNGNFASNRKAMEKVHDTKDAKFDELSKISVVTPKLKRKRQSSRKLPKKSTAEEESESNAAKSKAGNISTRKEKAIDFNYPKTDLELTKKPLNLSQLAFYAIKSEILALKEGYKSTKSVEVKKVLRCLKVIGDQIIERLQNDEFALEEFSHSADTFDLQKATFESQNLGTILKMFEEEEKQIDEEIQNLTTEMLNYKPPKKAELKIDDSNFDALIENLSCPFISSDISKMLENMEKDISQLCGSLKKVKETSNEVEEIKAELFWLFKKWQFSGYANESDPKEAIRLLQAANNVLGK